MKLISMFLISLIMFAVVVGPSSANVSYSFEDGEGVDYLADDLGDFERLKDKVDIISGSITVDGNGFELVIEMKDVPLNGRDFTRFASNQSGLLMRVETYTNLSIDGELMYTYLWAKTLRDVKYNETLGKNVLTTFFWQLYKNGNVLETGYGNYSVDGNSFVFHGSFKGNYDVEMPPSEKQYFNVSAWFNWQGIYLVLDNGGINIREDAPPPKDTPVVDPDTSPGIVPSTDTDDGVGEEPDSNVDESGSSDIDLIPIGLIVLGIVAVSTAFILYRRRVAG